eukprot:bmy_21562T0
MFYSVQWHPCQLTQTSTLVFMLLDKGSLDWDGGWDVLPFLLKQIHARVHSSFPKDCLDSQLSWLGCCVEQFGLKVMGGSAYTVFCVLRDRL